MSDMKRLPVTWMEDQTQKRLSVSTGNIMAKAKSVSAMLKEKAGPDYDAAFTVSAYVKAAEEFGETLDKLITGGRYLPEKYSIWMKSPYSGNGCLKGLSCVRRPNPGQVSRLLRTG